MHTRQRDMSSAVAGKPTTTIAMWRCRQQDRRPGTGTARRTRQCHAAAANRAGGRERRRMLCPPQPVVSRQRPSTHTHRAVPCCTQRATTQHTSTRTHLEAPPADAGDVAQVVHHDGHHRGVPVAQHVQAQLLQARPEVVGVVVQLLDLARTTVRAVLALRQNNSQPGKTRLITAAHTQ